MKVDGSNAFGKR